MFTSKKTLIGILVASLVAVGASAKYLQKAKYAEGLVG